MRNRPLRWIFRFGFVLFVVGSVNASVGMAQNVNNYETISEPILFLLREPSVHRDLALTRSQRTQLTGLNESFDDDLLSSRNLTPEEAGDRVSHVLTETRSQIENLLDAKQRERLRQIGYRVRGISFVLIPEVAEQLELTHDQRERIETSVRRTGQQIGELQKRMREGTLSQQEANQSATQARKEQQVHVLDLLDDHQRRQLLRLIGATFDPANLGQVSFRAPNFSDATAWINSDGLQLSEMRDKVVVVHFFAFGCINCIRNYPWYRKWHDQFSNQDVVMVGIHTPETQAEREVDRLREKIQEEQLKFPVLVDNDNENWNRWGNSMWPSVYLVDKRGRIRYWWYGELNWKGAGGQEIMAQRIEQLLAESN